jgi:hypothetical protein
VSTPRDTGLGRGRPADMPTRGTSDGSGQAYAGRRLADRYLDEGGAVAQQYAAQDRYDPTRPPLRVLVAEALAAAERRGEQRAQAAAAADRDALLDLLGAVERFTAARELSVGRDLVDAAGRARRHLERTEGP